MRPILYLAWAEVLHVVRDHATLAQALIVPIVQLLVLSNAATLQIKSTPTYIVDLDRSSLSRGLISRFEASGHFQTIGLSQSEKQADQALLSADATMVMTIPADFERTLMRTGAAPVQLAVNAEKGSAAGIVQLYATRILSAYSTELNAEIRPTAVSISMRDADTPPLRGQSRLDISARSWYNPTLNYKHYMVPGLLVSLVTLIATLLSAQNVAREKELGTLEQLNVTPITRTQFIAGKLLPFWVLAFIDLGIGLTLGRLVFGMPIEGNILLLLGAAAIYLVAALSVGLWISTIVETQQQAMFVTFFILIIYLLMSGLFTPIDSMAPWVQVFSQINPVRHFVAISRAVLIKGAGLAEIVRPLSILVVYAVVMLTVAVRQYSKRVA